MFKIINAGDGGVGKTTFLKRYTIGKFVENSKETIGTGFFAKSHYFGRKKEKIDLTMWDLGGQERFRHIVKGFILGAVGALLFYDITRYKTFDGLDEWLEILRNDEDNADMPIILIGTKCDLDDFRTLDIEDAKAYARDNDLLGYVETSSKTGENIDETMQILVDYIFKLNKGIYK